MSRNPHEPTPELRKRVFRLTAAGGRQPDIALLLGISDKTLRHYYREELDEGKADMTAAVINALLDMIKKGNRSHAFFYEKCHGGEEPNAKALIEHAQRVAVRDEEARKVKAAYRAEWMRRHVEGCDGKRCETALLDELKRDSGAETCFTKELLIDHLKTLLKLIEKAKADVAQLQEK